jgi:predicted lipid-binding transport protein (Tim44 family)
VQQWWSDDANKAGLAAGALGGLATWGLLGNKNKFWKMLASLGIGYGAYKGGQHMYSGVRKAWDQAKAELEKRKQEQANKQQQAPAEDDASAANTPATQTEQPAAPEKTEEQAQ